MMTKSEFKNAQSLIDNFEPLKIRDRTFLEISKYPRLGFENVCSNTLSFFFNPDNEHGLDDLLLKSFFEISKLNKLVLTKPDYSEIEIFREDVTSDFKRLDLLIKGKNFVIGIENKIGAKLDNDLSNYKKKLLSYNKDILIPVVLSVNNLKIEEMTIVNDAKFKSITYSEFFKCLENRLLPIENTIYSTYLFDFINTIKNLENNKKLRMKKEYYNWFAENESKIEKLENNFKKFENQREIYLEGFKRKIETLGGIKSEESNIWNSKTLYFDFSLEKETIKLHINLSRLNEKDCWNISIRGRTKKDEKIIESFFHNSEISYESREGKNWFIKEFLHEDMENAALFTIKVSNIIKEFRRNKK